MCPKSPKKNLKIPPINSENRKDINPFSAVDIFLHEPIRLQIVAQLNALHQADMIFLKNTLNLSWGNLSFHTTKLEEKGLITITKQFVGKKPYTILQITSEGIIQFEKYKNAMKYFLY